MLPGYYDLCDIFVRHFEDSFQFKEFWNHIENMPEGEILLAHKEIIDCDKLLNENKNPAIDSTNDAPKSNFLSKTRVSLHNTALIVKSQTLACVTDLDENLRKKAQHINNG